MSYLGMLRDGCMWVSMVSRGCVTQVNEVMGVFAHGYVGHYGHGHGHDRLWE